MAAPDLTGEQWSHVLSRLMYDAGNGIVCVRCPDCASTFYMPRGGDLPGELRRVEEGLRSHYRWYHTIDQVYGLWGDGR